MKISEEIRRLKLRWQHVKAGEGGNNESSGEVKCEVRTRSDQPEAWEGMGALREITGTEGLMGKAQAEGANPWNLRAMMGLGLVVSWGSVWEHGTDYVSLSMIPFLLIHRTQIYSYMSM